MRDELDSAMIVQEHLWLGSLRSATAAGSQSSGRQQSSAISPSDRTGAVQGVQLRLTDQAGFSRSQVQICILLVSRPRHPATSAADIFRANMLVVIRAKAPVFPSNDE